MTYSVYQHWDPLKVCIVGRSYSPQFYNFITNSRVRSVMERIAEETEEDYQKLITLLEHFGVKVLRPNVSNDYKVHMIQNGRIEPPPMVPRDYSIMLGKDFYLYAEDILSQLSLSWEHWKGKDWPSVPTNLAELDQLPAFVKDELSNSFLGHSLNEPTGFNYNRYSNYTKFIWQPVINHLKSANVSIINSIKFSSLKHFNSASCTRVGKDLYFGTKPYEDKTHDIKELRELCPNYRCHTINTGGHNDSTFCPVVPGLIVSLADIPTYSDTFPDWEVVYLPGQSWSKVRPFLKLKEKNAGKWWVPGEELNDEFTDFVESWLSHWVGYVEETVFDVNMLMIDEKNVVCNNYNEKVFSAFDRYGITAHVINFRHRYFWDGGLHCITSDVHREGTIKDYFPNRS